jgi:hypothetical protein
MHRADGRGTRPQRHFDVESVDEIRGAGAAQIFEQAAHPPTLGSCPRGDRSRQLAGRVGLHHRFELRVRCVGKRAQQLARVCLYAAAAGLERERVQDDSRTQLVTVPSNSQKNKSLGKISKYTAVNADTITARMFAVTPMTKA